jgi:pyruvate kinase
MRKTKVVCTLGPASSEEDILKKMMISGMNIVRLNFSHGTYEEHRANVEKVMKLREQLDLPVALLLDTKGPEIRTGKFENDFAELEEKQIFTFVVEDIKGDSTRCTTSFKNLYKDAVPGNVILVNDGLVEMDIEEIRGTNVVCRVKNSGLIGSYKGMHVRGASLSLPSVTEKDIQDIKFGIENGFDFIAVSFVRNSSDVESIRKILKENGGQDILLISKIECREAVDDVDKIIEVSDGIMVARGDLGVDIPPEEVPSVQKMLISKCIKAGKPVITATQMLESMVNNPRPTRAEASDVANAIYDGTSAVMLSGETAAGKYPIESLQMMVRIIDKTEEGIDYIKRFTLRKYEQNVNITNAISHATCTTAHDLNASAIISITTSGHTARQVSKFKPTSPIIAVTTSKRIRRQLSLWWGINSYVIPIENNTDKLFSLSVDKAISTGMIKKGDIVVITAGVPVGVKGTTNIMKVEIVGEDKNEDK